MTPSEAKVLLSYHSGRNADIDHPKWETGFLGSLRPFRGYLLPENFHEVMACLRALAPEISQGGTIDREVVNDVVGILHLGRSWAIHPDGMLQRNNLISEADVARLEDWLDTISYSFMMVLDSDDPEEWFSQYEDGK
ncbi:MAG: hypothetical protein P1U89_20760 [Verrucomicrobiales bacterium]|nr:hypothetical protein [Verrucomicrobiales bacterium]